VFGFIRTSGDFRALEDKVPWWTWLQAVAAVLFVAWLADSAQNKKIKAGDPDAITKRILFLVENQKYIRQEAEAAVQKMVGR
jgi:hypothetical protein